MSTGHQFQFLNNPDYPFNTVGGVHTTDWVNTHEAFPFEVALAHVIPFLPKKKSLIADIGAAFGRDSYGMAEKGHTVYAVEPSEELIEVGKSRYPHERITWVDDRLPSLHKLHYSNLKFDFILVSCVWMFLGPSTREAAMKSVVNLLKPGGILAIIIRYPGDESRSMYTIKISEVINMARQHGLKLIAEKDRMDLVGRDVKWETVIFKK